MSEILGEETTSASAADAAPEKEASANAAPADEKNPAIAGSGDAGADEIFAGHTPDGAPVDDVSVFDPNQVELSGEETPSDTPTSAIIDGSIAETATVLVPNTLVPNIPVPNNPVPVMSQRAPAETLVALERARLFVRHDLGAQLHEFTVSVDTGETLVLLGERGSGNKAALKAFTGLSERGEFLSGNIRFRGGAPQRIDRRNRDTVRMSWLAGPYANPLSPHARVVEQLSRVIGRKTGAPLQGARSEFAASLSRLKGAPALSAFEKPPTAIAPEILAWGLLAASLAQTPDLLLADDPFQGLGPSQTKLLVARLLDQQKRLGFAIVYAAMNTEVIRRLGGKLIVFRHGRVVEEGSVSRLATGQAHAYTQSLFKAATSSSARPHHSGARMAGRAEPVLQVHALEWRRNPLVGPKGESVTFELRRGSSLGFVGEPDSGRRELMRAVVGLDRVQAGRVIFDSVDIGILSSAMMARLRRRVAFISGDDDALDPRMTLADTVTEPLRAHIRLPRGVLADYREVALRRVGLASLPARIPVGALSAFDRRRLEVARAIVGAPLLVVVDEPLRGLDAFAQNVMRDLLREVREQEGPAFLVLTSDFTVAQSLCDEAMVFHNHRIVERGHVEVLLSAPKDPRTRRLVDAVTPGRT